MKDCVFCKIVNGEIDSVKIWEDEDILVFLDVNPVSEGHSLVIPKKHHENVFEIPNDLLGKINIVCKKIAKLQKEKLGISAVNILSASGREAQQSVFHIHYHVVPRKEGDGLDLWFQGKSKEIDELKRTAEKIKGSLEN